MELNNNNQEIISLNDINLIYWRFSTTNAVFKAFCGRSSATLTIFTSYSSHCCWCLCWYCFEYVWPIWVMLSLFQFCICICWYYFEDMWPRWVMLTIVIAIHWFLSRFSWAEQRNQGVQEPPLMLSRYYPPPSLPLLPLLLYPSPSSSHPLPSPATP